MAWFTKNDNPNLYLENPKATNCGSFAMNVIEWYTPGNVRVSQCFVIEQFLEDGLSLKEIENNLLNWYVDLVLEDFGNDIREINKSEIFSCKEDEEPIAFRVFVTYDKEEDTLDSDFHFRVFRNGRWQEKNGVREVHDCSFTEYPWVTSDGLRYTSNVIYFAHKVNSKLENF